MCVVVGATSWWCRRVLRWVTRDKTGLLDEEELTLALRMLNVTNVKEVLLPPLLPAMKPQLLRPPVTPSMHVILKP